MGAVKQGAGITLIFSLLLTGCATLRQKTESYILMETIRIMPPIDAYLRTIEIMADNLPLTEDYALISDSLIAIASRHGFHLATTRSKQPHAITLVIHEHSASTDLSTTHTVMAVLTLETPFEDPLPAARVIYSAVMRDSAVSLFQVTEICEHLFASMEKALQEKARASPHPEAGP